MRHLVSPSGTVSIIFEDRFRYFKLESSEIASGTFDRKLLLRFKLVRFLRARTEVGPVSRLLNDKFSFLTVGEMVLSTGENSYSFLLLRFVSLVEFERIFLRRMKKYL